MFNHGTRDSNGKTHECCHIFHANNENHQWHQIIRHDSLSMHIPARRVAPSKTQECHHAETHDGRAQDLNDTGERDTEPRMHGRSVREKEKEVHDDGGVEDEDVRRNGA